MLVLKPCCNVVQCCNAVGVPHQLLSGAQHAGCRQVNLVSVWGRNAAAQDMVRNAVEHMQSSIVEPCKILDDNSRDDLYRSLLWYAGHARRRNDAPGVQQTLNSLQAVLEMRGLSQQEPLVGFMCRQVISIQTFAGAIFGAAAMLLCSSWQLILLLVCLVFAVRFSYIKNL